MVDDPLDIFDPKHIYPTQDSAPERDKGKKSILNMNTKELREHFKQKREEDRVKKHVNNLHARDEYVRRLEDQLVDLKSFVSFNKLEPDLEKYRNKVKQINEKKK